MRHKCPQAIIDLYDTEHNAALEGRHVFFDWLDSLDLNLGDEVEVPEVYGTLLIWRKDTITKREIN